jgi:hypothetical protein
MDCESLLKLAIPGIAQLGLAIANIPRAAALRDVTDAAE